MRQSLNLPDVMRNQGRPTEPEAFRGDRDGVALHLAFYGLAIHEIAAHLRTTPVEVAARLARAMHGADSQHQAELAVWAGSQRLLGEPPKFLDSISFCA